MEQSEDLATEAINTLNQIFNSYLCLLIFNIDIVRMILDKFKLDRKWQSLPVELEVLV